MIRCVYGWRRFAPTDPDQTTGPKREPVVWSPSENMDDLSLPDSEFIPVPEILYAPGPGAYVPTASVNGAAIQVAAVLRSRQPHPAPPQGLKVDAVEIIRAWKRPDCGGVKVHPLPRLVAWPSAPQTLFNYAAVTPVQLKDRDQADRVRNLSGFDTTDLVVTQDNVLRASPARAKARRAREINRTAQLAQRAQADAVEDGRRARLRQHEKAAERAVKQLLEAPAVPYGVGLSIGHSDWLCGLYRLQAAVRLHEAFYGRRKWRALNFVQCFLREHACRLDDEDLREADLSGCVWTRHENGPDRKDVIAFWAAEAARQRRADAKFARATPPPPNPQVPRGPNRPEGATQTELLVREEPPAVP